VRRGIPSTPARCGAAFSSGDSRLVISRRRFTHGRLPLECGMDFLSSANSVLTPDLRLRDRIDPGRVCRNSRSRRRLRLDLSRNVVFPGFVQTLVMGGVGDFDDDAGDWQQSGLGDRDGRGAGSGPVRQQPPRSRDMILIFASLVIGIASGTRAFAVVGAGTILFCAVALYLSRVSFGLSSCFDALLRYTLSAGNPVSTGAAQGCRRRPLSKAVLVMMQQVTQARPPNMSTRSDFAARGRARNWFVDLERVPGLTDLSLMLEEARVDVLRGKLSMRDLHSRQTAVVVSLSARDLELRGSVSRIGFTGAAPEAATRSASLR